MKSDAPKNYPELLPTDEQNAYLEKYLTGANGKNIDNTGTSTPKGIPDVKKALIDDMLNGANSGNGYESRTNKEWEVKPEALDFIKRYLIRWGMSEGFVAVKLAGYVESKGDLRVAMQKFLKEMFLKSMIDEVDLELIVDGLYQAGLIGKSEYESLKAYIEYLKSLKGKGKGGDDNNPGSGGCVVYTPSGAMIGPRKAKKITL